MEKLRNNSVSELAFHMLNPDANYFVKEMAEEELRSRTRCLHFDSFIASEKSVMDERGYDINSYLFKEEPDMQLYMETYFKYVHNLPFAEKKVTFSESHLCNTDVSLDRTASKIIRAEYASVIKNIFGCKLAFGDIKSTNMALGLLEQRIGHDEMLKSLNLTHLLENSDSIQRVEGYDYNMVAGSVPLEFIEDRDKYKEEHPALAKLYEIKAMMLMIIEEGMLDSDIAQSLIMGRFIASDAAKVSKQKRILLKQARSPHFVDYKFLEKK